MNVLADSLRRLAPASFRTSSTHGGLATRIRERFGSGAALRIGESEGGRPIEAYVLGDGPINVSLIAGNHADEPVGPETLRCLLELFLANETVALDLLDQFRFFIVPHTNPDGEDRNSVWMERWPDLHSFLTSAQREAPGRDIEFGFPDLRPENRAVAAFLATGRPIRLHMSLHGMAVSMGALLLIDRMHAPHAGTIREMYRRAASACRIPLHDENRMGEKGFFYLGPGFWTTPEGAAMREHFQMIGDPDTADGFRDTSMEFVAKLGGKPLCLVTEVPLFLIAPEAGDDVMTQVRRMRGKRSAKANAPAFDSGLIEAAVSPVSIVDAVYLQGVALQAGLEYVRRRPDMAV